MPWNIGDVDRHKKDLTDKQKELWIQVANSALERCLKAGGEDCDASAIRQANSVVEKQMSYEDWEKEYKQTQTFNIQGVEIFSVGIWNGDPYVEKDLDAMEIAFSEVGFEPPLKLGHGQTDGQPAYGWIGRVYRQGKKLLADFKDLPQKVYEAMKRGNYKRVSAEVFWNYTGKDGKIFPRVLKAVALLGADIPAVTDLESIQNLYKQDDQDVRIYEDLEIYIKASEIANKQIAKEKETMDLKELQKKYDDLKAEKEALEAKTVDSDKTKADLEKEKADLEIKFAETEEAKTKAEAKLAEQQVEAKASQVKAFIAEQKIAGKVLPKFEKELESVLMAASDEKVFTYKKDDKDVQLSQKETIERIITSLPKIIEFAELASDEDVDLFSDDYTDPGVEIDRRAKLLIDKEKAKTYDEAVSMVLNKDAELKKAYAGGA